MMCQSNTTNIYYVFYVFLMSFMFLLYTIKHNKGLLCLTDTSLYIYIYMCIRITFSA